MRLGRFHLHLPNDGEFRLDGGAMFGVVPKVLWERRKPADERNRIRMTANCLLVECGDELLLIDSGLGAKNDEKFEHDPETPMARLREAEHGRFEVEPLVAEPVLAS